MPGKQITIRYLLYLGIAGIILLLPKYGLAQDLHFSQFQKAPLLINPASTGDFDGEWRFIHNYRSQWRAVSNPFQTYSISFDKNVQLPNRTFSYGGILLYDRSGIISLEISKINLNASYQWLFYRKSFRIGIQAGWNLYQYSLDGMTTDSQWDMSTGLFNPSLGSSEIADGEFMHYPGVNAGVSYRFFQRNTEHSIGLSLHQINFPKAGFDVKSMIDPGLSIQYSNLIPLSSRVRLQPALIYRHQSQAEYLVIGANYIYLTNLNDYQITGLEAGLKVRTGFDRVSDAFVLHGGVKFLRTEFGISYDVNISEFHQASNYQGAFELYIIYQAFVKQAYPGAIPCSRQ